MEVIGAPAMRAIGAVLGRSLMECDGGPIVIALEGELGAGKTTLVGGILTAFGVAGPVRSPTYTLVEPYEVARSIYHLDLYRLVDPRELEPLGMRDMLTGSAVLLIEWPSRAGSALPPTDLTILIEYEAVERGGRRLTASSNTRSGDKLVQAIVAVQPELKSVSS